MVCHFSHTNAIRMMLLIIFVTIIRCVRTRDSAPNSNNDDLINFIDLLNNRVDDDVIGKSKYLRNPELKRSNEQDKFVEIMRLLQKNYDAREESSYNDDERLHFIRNPELLDEFRSHGRKRSSPEYDGDFDEETLKQLLQSLRRNAVLRLQKEKSLNPPVLRFGSKIDDFDQLDLPAKVRDGVQIQKRVRPKLRKGDERYEYKSKGGFGRTSIPFAGKRGVFDENYN